MANPPDFRWSSFYYPEILAALIQIKRTTWPEHTEENDHDPVIQLYRAFALVSHLQACRLDHAARELYLPTARLRSSVIALGRLVGYELATAVPGEVQVLGDVSGKLSSSTTLIRSGSLFATEGDGTTPAILFEYEGDDVTAGPTGDAGLVVMEDNGGVLTDLTAGLSATLWGGTPSAGDALYFRAQGLMFNKLGLDLSGTPSLGSVRWEYFDDLRDGTPNLTVVLGGGLRFHVNSVIGSTDATGLVVTVTCTRTGVSTTAVVYYDPTFPDGATNAIEITSFLGQSSPSGSSADYLIQSDWIELPGLVDGTVGLTETGDVTWTLPDDTDHRWGLGGGPDEAQWWIRARVVDAGSTPASPDLDALTEPRKVTYTTRVDTRQGKTVVERIGTTDAGSADQAFAFLQEVYMELETLTVGGDEWAAVSDFLSSASWDRHVRIREEPDGSWWATFGDGETGKIPPASAVVVATYRIGGDYSGNVGALAITRDRSGNSRIRNPRNPRAGAGWVAQEGTTADSLDLLRDTIPASVRAGDRAVTLPDYETLAEKFRTADGSQVAERSLAVAEAAGAKTVGVVCVAPGGVAPSAADLAELQAYFNGTPLGLQLVGGVVPGNTEARCQSFTPYVVNVTAAIEVLADYSEGAQAAIEAALGGILTPTAKRMIRNSAGEWVEGATYLWTWGGTFSPSLLVAAIATAIEGVVSITVSSPGGPFTLGATELPTAGTLAITVTSV